MSFLLLLRSSHGALRASLSLWFRVARGMALEESEQRRAVATVEAVLRRWRHRLLGPCEGYL